MDAQQLINEGRIAPALAALQDLVRKDPANPKYRTFLFQLLCVQGQWNRALTQVNVAAEMDAGALPMAQTYREAIQCEALREEIFAGRRLPVVFGEPLPWIALLAEALQLEGQGNAAAGAQARARGLEDAAAVGGTIISAVGGETRTERFEWLADADARLGPVLEAIINGRYLWVPLQHVSRIDIEAPEDLRDKVWMPASFTFTTGAGVVGLIPTRYAGTLGAAAAQDAGTADALLLARRTEWTAEGAGIGQRMFATDAGDYALMDVRSVEFDDVATDDEDNG
jgi:type VI secretion system protein ImpE